MKILLALLAMLLTCGLTGLLLLFAVGRSASCRRMALPIGYAYSLVAFYIFYIFSHSPACSTCCTLGFPLVLVAVRLLFRKCRHRKENPPVFPPQSPASVQFRQDLIPVAALLLIVLALAAWPYLATGWGAYWHSGNYDMEDGLNGRDAYMDGLIFQDGGFDAATLLGDRTWFDYVKTTGTLGAGQGIKANSYKEWYAGDSFRFQYSSLAFWSALLYEPHGLDVLLVQALLNLLLMASGIYFLCRHGFCLYRTPSTLAAAVSVCSAFYLTTFFAGHMGSMMYSSLIPALLDVMFLDSRYSPGLTRRFVWGGLLTVAILFTYPHPLPLVILPVAACHILSSERIQNLLSSILLFARRRPALVCAAGILLGIAMGLAFWGLYRGTEGYRLRQDVQYRAWGYTHDWLIIPLFLGLLPSPLEASAFVNRMIALHGYSAFLVISCGLAALLCFLYSKARAPRLSAFFPIFGFLWVLELFLFRFFIVDSYYLYKFLYVHQFVFVIGIVSFMAQNRSRILAALAGAVMLLNFCSDAIMAYGIFSRPYNRAPENYRSLLSVDPALLRRSFVELTGGMAVAVRQTLKAQGIETQRDPRFAEYFIVPARRESEITGSQFTDTIAETGELALKVSPSQNYLMIRTWFQPEFSPADPVLKNTAFRWVGQEKNDNVSLYIVRPAMTAQLQGRFLQVCFQKGPSAGGSLPIRFSSADQTLIHAENLTDNAVHCAWLPAEQVVSLKQPLLIRSGVRGKSLLPRDDRVLLYRIFKVGWTDRRYDEHLLSLFNLPEDIIRADTDKTEHTMPSPVRLGQGWGNYETFAGETFRWVSGPADLILKESPVGGTARVVLDTEPGPSHGKEPFQLEAWDEAGRLAWTSEVITGRNRVVLSLPRHAQRSSVYTLRTRSASLPVPRDARILNYRVFRITLP